MIFDRNEQKQIVALLGAGSMGTAIVRRIGAGKKILLGDISEKVLERVGEDFRRCGYDVDTIQAVKQCKVEMSDPSRLAYWQTQYTEYKQLANRRFFGDNSTAATQGKFYSTLRGFIIAQLRKTTE